MMTDPISDMLTRIRNAYMAKKQTTSVPHSKLKFALAKIMEKEGYLSSVEVKEQGVKKSLELSLKYDSKEPAIQMIRRVSTPGCRVYAKSKELPFVLADMGIAIVSTPNGLMTNKEARKRSLGGEIICEMY